MNRDDDAEGAASPPPLTMDKPKTDVRGIAKSTFNFANSILGAGIIGMPFALKRTGLFFGLGFMAFVAYLTAYSSRMLVECAHEIGAGTYEELCRRVLGRKVGPVVVIRGCIFKCVKSYTFILVCMATLAFGGMVAYMIIIGETATYVLNSVLGPIDVIGSRYSVLSMISLILILPLCMGRDISNLAHFSFFGLCAIGSIVGTVVWRGPIMAAGGIPMEGVHEPLSIVETTLFAGIGTMSFAFVCNHNAFIVFNSMKNPTPRQWRLVTNMSVGCALVMCAILGVSGYVNFRSATKADILNNFPLTDSISNVLRALLSLTMILTFPMEMFVSRHCLLEAFSPGETNHSRRSHIIATLALWSASLTVALTVPDLAIVIGLCPHRNRHRHCLSIHHRHRNRRYLYLHPMSRPWLTIELPTEITGALSASCLGYVMPGILSLYVIGIDDVKANLASAWKNGDGTSSPLSLPSRIQMVFRDVGPAFLIVFGAIAMVAGTVSALL